MDLRAYSINEGVIVGRKQKRHPGFLINGREHFNQMIGGFRIQICRRFIGEDDVGFGGQSASDRNTLLLATAQLIRIGTGAIREANGRESIFGPRSRVAGIVASNERSKFDVLDRRQNRKKIVRLKNKPDVSASEQAELFIGHSRHLAAADRNFAGGGMIQARCEIEKGRLAAPRGTDWNSSARVDSPWDIP
jgi:hypothetical protein